MKNNNDALIEGTYIHIHTHTDISVAKKIN